MKRIMTAMGNEVLNMELKKYSKYDVILEDIICQDHVISKLAKYQVDILIISGLLQGRWNLEEFIEKIRKENSAIRIIIVTDEIDHATKQLLEEYDVLDIFIDSMVEVQDIIEAIDREDSIKKKYEMIAESKEEYRVNNGDQKENLDSFVKEKILIEKAVQKQEIITISGIPGSGKSTIAANLCKVLSQKSDSKILLMDLDTLNGNIEEILKIDKVPTNIEMTIDEDKKAGLNYATELMIKNRFDSNVFGELVIDANGFDVLTGNTSLHYCQNVLEEKYYDKILQCAKEKYDFIVIDTSSNIFLDSTKWAIEVASKVFLVTEGNYISVKKLEQFIDIIVGVWGILKGKLHILVNKKYKNEIEQEAIYQITNGLQVIGEIKQNEENSMIPYEKILSTIHYIPKKSILKKFSAMKNNLFLQSKVEKGVPVHAN